MVSIGSEKKMTKQAFSKKILLCGPMNKGVRISFVECLYNVLRCIEMKYGIGKRNKMEASGKWIWRRMEKSSRYRGYIMNKYWRQWLKEAERICKKLWYEWRKRGSGRRRIRTLNCINTEKSYEMMIRTRWLEITNLLHLKGLPPSTEHYWLIVIACI